MAEGDRGDQTGRVARQPPRRSGLDTLLLIAVVAAVALLVLSLVGTIVAILRAVLTVGLIVLAVVVYFRLRGRGR